MTSAADIIAEIDKAFAGCAKPVHFTNFAHCEECAEHDQLLRDRTRETLAIEDVGNIGWDPICFSSAAGIAYYFPKLARLALSSVTYTYGWYGDLLMIHLTSGGSSNSFLRFCDFQQRSAVGHLIEHLQANLPDEQTVLTNAGDFVEALALWVES